MKTALTALLAVTLLAITGPALFGNKDKDTSPSSGKKKKVVFTKRPLLPSLSPQAVFPATPPSFQSRSLDRVRVRV